MFKGKLLHGGDYNPEQWLDCPEILEEDIRLMEEAGVNCVTLGVFSWAVLEPEEGVYDFNWLEERIDRLGEAGIQVILATPSGAMPHWLTQKYPEAMQVQENGKRNLPGKRHNFCYTFQRAGRKLFGRGVSLQVVSGGVSRLAQKEIQNAGQLKPRMVGEILESCVYRLESGS